ncbi:hypothetical protein C2W64_01159 [Brevibacillus laterosporus]|nr:hypothetical protein C2W64_01159 [Brevibacillus laterosporus]
MTIKTAMSYSILKKEKGYRLRLVFFQKKAEKIIEPDHQPFPFTFIEIR